MYEPIIPTMLVSVLFGTLAAFIYTIFARHPLYPPDYAHFRIRMYESVGHLVILLAYAEILYAIKIIRFSGSFYFPDIIIY